jgi:hypothetical protein
MATVIEPTRSFEFLISPANGDLSFEEVTVVAPGAMLPGALLGKLTSNGNYVPYLAGAATGAEIVSGVLCIGIPAASTVKRAIVAREATVKKYKLVYTGTEATVIAGLKALAIIAR